jgi:hypothetical protein
MNPYESPAYCQTESLPMSEAHADKMCLGGMLTCMAIGLGWMFVSFAFRDACAWAWDNHNLAFKVITAGSMMWWMPLNLIVLFVLIKQKFRCE